MIQMTSNGQLPHSKGVLIQNDCVLQSIEHTLNNNRSTIFFHSSTFVTKVLWSCQRGSLPENLCRRSCFSVESFSYYETANRVPITCGLTTTPSSLPDTLGSTLPILSDFKARGASKCAFQFKSCGLAGLHCGLTAFTGTVCLSKE